mmetsp:Transcript_3246/g.4954  ORF Transcript_3246/g.4954 Transcript_3246/m.4954 type:complete len:85 (-) Transcript_3246:529-783(-)
MIFALLLVSCMNATVSAFFLILKLHGFFIISTGKRKISFLFTLSLSAGTANDRIPHTLTEWPLLASILKIHLLGLLNGDVFSTR